MGSFFFQGAGTVAFGGAFGGAVVGVSGTALGGALGRALGGVFCLDSLSVVKLSTPLCPKCNSALHRSLERDANRGDEHTSALVHS